MFNDIKLLEKLEVYDQNIVDLEKKINDNFSLKEKLEQETLSVCTNLNQIQANYDEKLKASKSFEQKIAFEDDRINQSQKKSTLVKSTNEYHKILKEIASRKQIKTDLEEQLLELMTEIESIENNLNDTKELSEKKSSELALVKEKIEENLDNWKSKIEDIKVTRDDVRKNVEPIILNQYTLLKNNSIEMAIVNVVNGVCQGCFMQLPPQLFNQLQRQDQFYQCPTCQRIIYFKKPE
ncbi:MAG: C4-type zinc ribbon domain-containing protein [Pseudomonadota bacterium]